MCAAVQELQIGGGRLEVAQGDRQASFGEQALDVVDAVGGRLDLDEPAIRAASDARLRETVSVRGGVDHRQLQGHRDGLEPRLPGRRTVRACCSKSLWPATLAPGFGRRQPAKGTRLPPRAGPPATGRSTEDACRSRWTTRTSPASHGRECPPRDPSRRPIPRSSGRLRRLSTARTSTSTTTVRAASRSLRRSACRAARSRSSVRWPPTSRARGWSRPTPGDFPSRSIPAPAPVARRPRRPGPPPRDSPLQSGGCIPAGALPRRGDGTRGLARIGHDRGGRGD